MVCHTCDTPSCINPLHLYLGDAKTNGKDKKDRDRAAKGSKQGSCVLSKKEIIELRDKREKGWTYVELADWFEVSPSTIRKVVKGETWGWIQ